MERIIMADVDVLSVQQVDGCMSGVKSARKFWQDTLEATFED